MTQHEHDKAYHPQQPSSEQDKSDVNPTANTSLTDPGPPPDATSTAPDLSAWDPTGKIDDEVERRYGSPKGGGTSTEAEDAGPGRYGGATDKAPTSPEAGATTTTAAGAAAPSDHTMRQTQPLGGTPDIGETWQGGAATQQAMQAGGAANAQVHDRDAGYSHTPPSTKQGEHSEVH